MKSKIILILAATTLVGGLALWLNSHSATDRATIKLRGAKGVPFTGTLTSDGVEVQITGTLPTDLAISGRNVNCQIRKTQAEGELSIEIITADSSRGSASTSAPQGGVRAFTQRGLFRRGFGTTTI